MFFKNNKPGSVITFVYSLLVVAIMLVLASCSSTVNTRNSYVEKEAEDVHIARVYFIRPMPVKYKGVADKRITVEINDEKLIEIREGQYTMVKLKPTKATITTRSQTRFINKDQPIDVSRSREYRFIAGKIYFIHLKRVDEEFRGIYYDPAPVTLDQALKLSDRLKSVGDAKNYPIKGITEVAEVPSPSPLEPALPENLYPGKPYLIKGNPEYTAPAIPEGKNEITFDQPPAAEQPAQPDMPQQQSDTPPPQPAAPE